MTPIRPIGANGVAPGVRETADAASDPASAAAAKKKADIAKVAREFEAVLVRQVLKSAKAAGDGSSSQYGGMAIDALADGIMHGGGLGLARTLELSLSNVAARAELHAHGAGTGTGTGKS